MEPKILKTKSVIRRHWNKLLHLQMSSQKQKKIERV